MSAALGLALTGVLLIFVALVVAFAADSSTWRYRSERLTIVGWIAFASGVLALIAAIWLEVAS